MGKLHDTLRPMLGYITNYLESLGMIKRGFINAYIGSTPMYASFVTETEAATFVVAKGPKVTLVDGKSANPDAVIRLTQAQLETMFQESVDKFDQKVADGTIKLEIYSGRGQQLVNQVRQAFGAKD